MFKVQEERGIYIHMPNKDTTSKDCGLAAYVAKDCVATHCEHGECTYAAGHHILPRVS